MYLEFISVDDVREGPCFLGCCMKSRLPQHQLVTGALQLLEAQHCCESLFRAWEACSPALHSVSRSARLFCARAVVPAMSFLAPAKTHGSASLSCVAYSWPFALSYINV